MPKTQKKTANIQVLLSDLGHFALFCPQKRVLQLENAHMTSLSVILSPHVISITHVPF
jgi:hypothetical protein